MHSGRGQQIQGQQAGDERAEIAALQRHHAVLEARRRNEQLISKLGLVILPLLVPAVIWRAIAIDFAGGVAILGLEALYFVTFVANLRRAKRKVPSQTQGWILTVVETVGPTAVIVIDSRISTELALHNATTMVYALSITLATLRLIPALPLASGILGALQFSAVYLYHHLQGATSEATMGPAFMLQRVGILIGIGIIATVASRRMLRLVNRSTHEAIERERVRHAFGTYVDQRVVDRLLSGDLEPRTERREVSALFVDIRGFTKFSEEHDPEQVFAVLNSALEHFCHAVLEHGGVVNKYLGDGLFALFGAVEDAPNHAGRAAMAALEMQSAAQNLATEGRFADLKIGIGINSGSAIVGDVGGRGQREYTAIGDVVNVAARLEAMNKLLGTSILIGEACAASLGDDFDLQPHGAQQVRGRDAAVEVFELRGNRRAGTATAATA